MIPVVLPISHTGAWEMNRGCGLQAESQTGPLTWAGRANWHCAWESSRGEVTCAPLPSTLGLKAFRCLASLWLQVFFPFLSSFDETIKGEYLDDSTRQAKASVLVYKFLILHPPWQTWLSYASKLSSPFLGPLVVAI